MHDAYSSEKFGRPSAPGDGLREQILRRFELWLDETLADEAPPEGIPAHLLDELTGEGAPDPTTSHEDTYALWSALTALTQETKLQGRAFQTLSQQLETLENMPEALQALKAAMGRIADDNARRVSANAAERRETERRVGDPYVRLLVDLHERLRRAATQAATADQEDRKPSIWARLTGRHTMEHKLAAQRNAYQAASKMLADRVEAFLVDRGVTHVPCQGEAFDPRTMTAVDVEQRDDVAEGIVVSELRGGYTWDGQIIQMAEVIVSRPTGGTL